MTDAPAAIYTCRLFARCCFDDVAQVWYPVVMEYRNGIFFMGHEYEIPCQEEELARLVAEMLRDEMKEQTEQSIKNTLNDIASRLPKAEDFEP